MTSEQAIWGAAAIPAIAAIGWTIFNLGARIVRRLREPEVQPFLGDVLQEKDDEELLARRNRGGPYRLRRGG